MLDLDTAVAHYLNAWSETDAAARAALLETCWEEDATFQDAMGAAGGRAALSEYIGNAQKFVPGVRLELNGKPERCGGYYRYGWLIRMADGNVMGRGTNFGQVAESGRLASAVGFWDKA